MSLGRTPNLEIHNQSAKSSLYAGRKIVKSLFSICRPDDVETSIRWHDQLGPQKRGFDVEQFPPLFDGKVLSDDSDEEDRYTDDRHRLGVNAVQTCLPCGRKLRDQWGPSIVASMPNNSHHDFRAKTSYRCKLIHARTSSTSRTSSAPSERAAVGSNAAGCAGAVPSVVMVLAVVVLVVLAAYATAGERQRPADTETSKTRRENK